MNYNTLNDEELEDLVIAKLVYERNKLDNGTRIPLSELFGEMRNLTEAEEISVRKGLAQISEPTSLKYDE